MAPNKYLSWNQIKQLRDFTKEQADTAKKRGNQRAVMNDVVIDIMLNSGLRASELCQLQIRDLPQSHGKMIINVRKGKGCLQRSVEISSALAQRINLFIKRYRKGAQPKSLLFLNERGGPLSYRSLLSKINTLGRTIGFDLKPHMLRHTYATAFYTRTKDLLMLQDQLGHADPRTTAIYARTARDERRKIAENFDL